MEVFFSNPNASRSFIFVFIGIHLLHVFAGLLVLLNVIRATYRNVPQVINLFKMEMASIFWHFLDIIWIYLYVFLLLNQH
jgi:cytochrome c oxidase subunit 3